MKRVVFAAWRFLAGLNRPSRSVNAKRLRERGETLACFSIREATAADIPALARLLRAEGINSMWLFGDARSPSSRVWTALGAEKTDDDPGNGNYGWRDLQKLASLCEASRDSSSL